MSDQTNHSCETNRNDKVSALPSPVLVIDSTPELCKVLRAMGLKVHQIKSGLTGETPTSPTCPYKLIIYDPLEVKTAAVERNDYRDLMKCIRSKIRDGATCIVFLNEVKHDSPSHQCPTIPRCAYDCFLTFGLQGKQPLSIMPWSMPQEEQFVNVTEACPTLLEDIMYELPWVESLLASDTDPFFGKRIPGNPSRIEVYTHPLTGRVDRCYQVLADERLIGPEVDGTKLVSLAAASNGKPLAFSVALGKGLILVLPQARQGNAHYLEGLQKNWSNILDLGHDEAIRSVAPHGLEGRSREHGGDGGNMNDIEVSIARNGVAHDKREWHGTDKIAADSKTDSGTLPFPFSSLPPEWEYQTGDPDMDRVANLLGHALLLALRRQVSRDFAAKQRRDIRAFKEDCIKVKSWFQHAAELMGKAVLVAECNVFLIDGLAWVDAVAGWERQDVSESIDMDEWSRLTDAVQSLMGRHQVLLGIAMQRWDRQIARSEAIRRQVMLLGPVPLDQIKEDLSRQTARIRQAMQADMVQDRRALSDKTTGKQKDTENEHVERDRKKRRSSSAFNNKVMITSALLQHHQLDSEQPKYEPATQKEIAEKLSWKQHKLSKAIAQCFDKHWWKRRYIPNCKPEVLKGFLKKLDDGRMEIEVPQHRPQHSTEREEGSAQNV